jgi:hypothetical protein
MAISQRHIEALRPYLVGERPRENGEWDMYCPLHDDSKRSASLNVQTGLWYCQAGCGGGQVTTLLRQRERWLSPATARSNGYAPTDKPPSSLTNGLIAGWASALTTNATSLQWLQERRGLNLETIVRYEIGWHPDKKVYTIPIRDPEGEIWNVRYYNPTPPPGRRKIWGEEGYNSPPRLYPISILDGDPDEIIIVEGEWDALLGIQCGYRCITRTGAADVWRGEWGELLANKVVYLAHDMDAKGQRANRKVARALHRAADVRIVTLPYALSEKHGRDLTDFLLEHLPGELREYLNKATPYGAKEKRDVDTITVSESFDAKRVGKPVRIVVGVKGRREPGYVVPRKVSLACTRDAGTKCMICPLNAAGGEAILEIEPDDPVILALMDANRDATAKEIATTYGVPGGRCARLDQSVDEYQPIEVLFARPALDYSDGTLAGQHKNIRITSVGEYDTQANHTIAATGALQPNPRTQGNEFLAWEIEHLETSVDHFELDDQSREQLALFRCEEGQRPLRKLKEIADDLSNHVTFIRGRPEMHALMDLTFHSVLSFNFGGQHVHRGWLESLIIGDTRTGKSEGAQQLVQHYGAGEIVGGEAATLAGLVGGLQQLGGRDWAVTWGIIPINDRRLVVIDELSGLQPEDISRMSDVRASGVARLTKIQQDVTHARTRLLWMGNPRNTDMSNYTYGVDAIRPLIGNSEDIARFDLAMALRLDDVSPERINQPHLYTNARYTADACHTALQWAWSRLPEQIEWLAGAEDRVFELANEMGKRYVENPPLVQAANVRIKIARVAAALAARTCSTTDFETLVIEPRHVNDAVSFMDRLYGMSAFGYLERSREQLEDRSEAEANKDEIRDYLETRPTLAKYLRSTGKFRRQDLEEVLNASRDDANAIINTMWEARMVRKDLGDIRVEPTLHALLREGIW